MTLICERPKITPHAAAMIERLATLLGVDPSLVSVKATTTERLGFTGRGEGIAAQAVATVLLPDLPGPSATPGPAVTPARHGHTEWGLTMIGRRDRLGDVLGNGPRAGRLRTPPGAPPRDPRRRRCRRCAPR